MALFTGVSKTSDGRISDVTDPTSEQDVATKAYADGLSVGGENVFDYSAPLVDVLVFGGVDVITPFVFSAGISPTAYMSLNEVTGDFTFLQGAALNYLVKLKVNFAWASGSPTTPEPTYTVGTLINGGVINSPDGNPGKSYYNGNVAGFDGFYREVLLTGINSTDVLAFEGFNSGAGTLGAFGGNFQTLSAPAPYNITVPYFQMQLFLLG